MAYILKERLDDDFKVDISKEAMKWLKNASPEKRRLFFSPECIKKRVENSLGESEGVVFDHLVMEEFVKTFTLFAYFYFLRGYPYRRAKFHFEYMCYFYDQIFIDKQKQRHSIASAREFLKTLDTKIYIIYLLAYQEMYFGVFATFSQEKIHNEIGDIKAKMKTPGFVQDFGFLIQEEKVDALTLFPRDEKGNIIILDKKYNEETIASFSPDDFEKTKQIIGARVFGSTVGSFGNKRGITHGGMKPTHLFLDDVETRSSSISRVRTNSIWTTLESDLVSSLAGDGSRILSLSNYFSDRGNIKRLLELTPEENKMIVGMFKDGNQTELSWPERFTIKESQSNKLRDKGEKRESWEALKNNVGETTGRLEYLCDPYSDDDLYHNITTIEKIAKPFTEPLEAWTDEQTGVVYNFYAHMNPKADYAVGVDLSEGIGLDSHAMVLYEITKGTQSQMTYRIVATAVSNNIPQNLFAHSNNRFWKYYGINPFVTPESNMGNSYIDTLVEIRRPWKSNKMIYQREITLGDQVRTDRAFGYRMDTANNRTVVSGEFKTAIECGEVINLCPFFHLELQEFTKSDHQANTRVTYLKESNAEKLTQHFDRISAGRVGLMGIRQFLDKKMKRSNQNESLESSGFFKKPTREDLNS